MKVTYYPNQLFSVEAEGASHKEVFTQLAGLSEVFSVDQCGCCKSKDLRPIVRDVQNVKHYELRCSKCGAKLAYGQSKDGQTLYPRKRAHKQHELVTSGKLQEGDHLPDGGWVRWQGTPS